MKFVQKSTFWNLDSLHNLRVLNEETDSRIGMYAKNWVGQAPFENFDFFGQSQRSTWSKLFLFSLSLSFFFFSFRRIGSGRSGSNRVGWTNELDWVWRVTTSWHHSTEGARVRNYGDEWSARERSASMRVRAWNDAGDHRTFWWHVEARVWDSWPEIFKSCRSKAMEDPGIVSFLKLWADLHSFEGLSRWSSRVYGGAWKCVRLFLGLQFLGFVARGLMDLVVAPVL